MSTKKLKHVAILFLIVISYSNLKANNLNKRLPSEHACAYLSLPGFNRIKHHSASFNGSQSENKGDVILNERFKSKTLLCYCR
jgi:hypothetical protein